MNTPLRPLVLCCSGHDPGGGAGIHADIEAVAAQGAHALTAITAHTVQDTQNVTRVLASDLALLESQIETLLADSQISAIKIGLLAEASQIGFLTKLIARIQVPVVLDPILRAGGGTNLADQALQNALVTQLLPVTHVLTPNAAEARRLTDRTTADDCGKALLDAGVRHVLITGGDELDGLGERVVNHWFSADAAVKRFEWPRLNASFHGAGCTLAASIAALLARGLAVEAALDQAQRYTHETLAHAFRSGRGRLLPGRIA